MSIREQAQALVSNLASLWNGGRPVLQRIGDESGRPDASPAAALASLSEEALEAAFSSPEARQELSDAFAGLTRYLASSSWFDRAVSGDGTANLSVLQRCPVAYFCAEFGLASWLPIYSGGLGVLAGDVLKEASDMGLPFVGIGLFYKHGFFHQRLDATGYQTEMYDTLDPAALGMIRAVDATGRRIVIPIPVADRTVYAGLWKLQVGRVSLYLLDTDFPENEREDDRAITASLYGGDAETRIRQELVLGIGGVRALRALELEPSLYSMNEGHAAFLGLELLADRLPGVSFEDALRETRPHIIYTNHTVVPAGNDVFSRDLVRRYVGPYADQRGIGVDRLVDLASPGSDSGFSMAVLAFEVSGKANAVSELHAKVIPREWPGFAVEAVTNGVHVPTWAGGEVTALLERYVPEWRGDSPRWEDVHSIPDAELWTAHEAQRRRMIAYVNGKQGTQLDPETLTLVWARRFAEYKRAGLLATDLSRLMRLLSDRERPVQLVISGKAHPRDEGGKSVLRDLLHRLEGESEIASRIAFIQDYDLDVARLLTAGADVWVNTPRKPLEASGTSGMKASDNGALQLTVEDGWAAEVNWWGVGWGIAGTDDAADARQCYEFLETGIVPTFYTRDAGGVPAGWVRMMKNSMVVTLSRYSSRRMMLDYLHKLYLPLLQEQSAGVRSAGV